MVSYLAQAVSEEATADIGVYSKELFNQLLGVDVLMVFRVMAFWMFFIWIVFALWVAFDASNRYKKWYVALLWFLFVLPGNIVGFIGYLFMRPVVTLEEKQWTRLEGKYLMQELSSINDCPNCGTIVNTSQNYCAACGTEMNVKCPSCQKYQSIYNVYCGDCGTQLQKEAVVPKQVVENVSETPVPKRDFLTPIKTFFSTVLLPVSKKQTAQETGKDQKQEKKSNKKK